MDRYSIALGKNPLETPPEPFFLYSEGRLADQFRMLVVGERRSGKTTFLIRDAVSSIKLNLFSSFYFFSRSIQESDNLQTLLRKIGGEALSSLFSFGWGNKMPMVRTPRTAIYIDEANRYEQSLPEIMEISSNNPRVLLSCSYGSLINSGLSDRIYRPSNIKLRGIMWTLFYLPNIVFPGSYGAMSCIQPPLPAEENYAGGIAPLLMEPGPNSTSTLSIALASTESAFWRFPAHRKTGGSS